MTHKNNNSFNNHKNFYQISNHTNTQHNTDHFLKDITSSNNNLINNNNKFTFSYSSIDNNNNGNNNNLNNSNNKHNFKSFSFDTTNGSPVDAQLSSPLTSTTHITDGILNERRELFIPGFMNLSNDINLNCLAFSILKILLPSLSQTDICGVRLARPRSPTLYDPDYMPDFPSFIVTLINAELVQLIMRAKKQHNYLTTNDINLSHLNPELACSLPNKKIFINEALSPPAQAQYILIKESAKKLGFKYIWHSAGRFLVRLRGGMRAYEVRSTSDLQTIINTQGNLNHMQLSKHLPILTQVTTTDNSNTLN